MSNFACLVCRNTEATLVYKACPDYYVGKPYLTDYYRCQRCQLVQQSPIPKDVSPFYVDYPIHRKKSALYDAFRWLVMGPVYFNPKLLKSGMQLLDYGCGDGSFLMWAQEKRPDLSYAGFELSEKHAVALSKQIGIPVDHQLDRLLDRWEGKCDVVTMHFTLEHVTDLHGTVKTIARLLKPGGQVYFVVPHFESLERVCFGKRWHNLDAPRHISFPDKRAMQALGQECGLSLQKSTSIAFPNGFAGSLAILKGRFRMALFFMFLPLGIVFSRLFPTGSQGVWLVKNLQQG